MSEVNQDFQELDTTVVQVRSVLNYMYTLGYTLDGTCKTGRFVSEQKELQGNRFLSFATAVKMHNSQESHWNVDLETTMATPTFVKMRKGFPSLGVRLAFASKLVTKVKLSVSRTGQVVTQSVMVKPLNETVARLVEPA